MCLGFVVAALFEFALIIFINRRTKQSNKPATPKNMQVELKDSVLASKLRKRKIRNIKIGTCGSPLNKEIDNCHENDEELRSKNCLFACLTETAPIHVIDAVSSWLFIISFGLFNYIYWSTIVERRCV